MNIKILLLFLLIVVLVWTAPGGKMSAGAGRDLKTGLQAAGEDLKTFGRDAADSIRNAVQ